jgi:hypothetical protein
MVSAVKRVPRCGWRDITFLNSHAPTEDKGDDWKESFYEEPERVFDYFPSENYVSGY